MSDMLCSRCGVTYDESFFRRTGSVTHMHMRNKPRLTYCIGCETTERDTEKQRDRWRSKASDALRRHADKFIDAGLISSRAELAERYGWDIDAMAHDLQHAYGNGCRYCRKPYGDMGHGLADITLDVTDPVREPFYATNTNWACQSCNRSKGRLTPEQWATRLLCWAKWTRRQVVLSMRPYVGPLFEWMDRAN